MSYNKVGAADAHELSPLCETDTAHCGRDE